MKQITLKQLPGDEGILDYREMLLVVATRHPHGITLDAMERVLRVKSALKKTAPGGVLKMEDADWDTLISYLMVYPFGISDDNLITMRNDVVKAEKVEIE